MIQSQKTIRFSILFICFFIFKSIEAQTFTKASGQAVDIAINPKNGKVFTVDSSTKEVFYFEGRSKKFKQHLKNANAKRLTISPQGEVWIVRENKKVAKQNNGKWEDITPFSYSKDISADEKGAIWSCFATNGKVIKYENGKWQGQSKYGAQTKRIAAANSSNLWLVREDQSIKHYFKNKLKNIKGKALDIAIDAITKDVYVVGISNRIYKWSKSKNDWILVPGTRNDISSIAVHNKVIWCTTTNNQIYYSSSSNSNSDGFTFSKEKKKLIVLLHGITATSTTKGGKENGVGTHRYPQFYWGFDYIRLMTGVAKSERIKMIPAPGSGLSPKLITADIWANHYKGAALFQKRKIDINRYASILRPDGANIDVMCTFRDGAKGLMTQTKAAINQIYDTYEKYYGHLPEEEQPMIYLIAHSFGGIVSRAILTNPTGKDISKVKLSKEDRKRADFIRNRTVWLTTLSTPHEGSPLPNKAHKTNADLKNSPIAPILEGFRKNDIDGEKPCLVDIKNSTIYQKKMLKPENAKRTNGELIPIYTMTGAHPGHVFYLHKRALGSIYDNSISDITRFYKEENEKKGYYKLGDDSFQLLLLDMLNASDKNYWPKVYGGLNIGDKFKIPVPINLADAVLIFGIQAEMKRDNYFDSDGFVSFNSGHGLKLGSSKVGHFSGKTGGSWYRLYGADYGTFHPWDLDNHRSICYNRGTGAFIGNYLMGKGPNAVRDIWSSWRKTPDSPQLRDKRVRIEFTGLRRLTGEDFGSDGYRVEVKIGQGPYQKSATVKEKKTINAKHYQANKDYIWTFSQGVQNATLVPVIIKVFNYRAALTDQLCSASPRPFVEELVFYVDAQNNKIYGDIEGNTGSQLIRVAGSTKSKRGVQMSFRVEVENK